MSLHDDIQNYINDLQALLYETDEQALLNKAREQWGEDDVRYEVLEQFVTSPQKFSKPPDPPEDIKSDGDQQNKTVRKIPFRKI
jgi:hypothetical protein